MTSKSSPPYSSKIIFDSLISIIAINPDLLNVASISFIFFFMGGGGIHFNLYKEDKTFENYGEQIKKVNNILSSWAYRDLTYFGRITVIKTLALPLLVQILTVLPSPPAQVMKEIQDIFYRFLWDGKPDNIKRNVIFNYEEGGGGVLKLPHIKSFCKALKMYWL